MTVTYSPPKTDDADPTVAHLPDRLQKMFDEYMAIRAMAEKAAAPFADAANDNDPQETPAIVVAHADALPATSGKPYFGTRAQTGRHLGAHLVRALGVALAEAAGINAAAITHIDIVATFGGPEHTYVARITLNGDDKSKRSASRQSKGATADDGSDAGVPADQ